MSAPAAGISIPRLPADLTERDQFVLWAEELRNGKYTKVPYQPCGRRAKTDDPTTWSPYDAVITAWRAAPARYRGIGFVFSSTDPFAGVDLDGCLDSSGALVLWAQPIIEAFSDTYMEISPSGKGVKIFTKAHLDGPGRRATYQDGALEVYDRGRFFTTTGQAFRGASLQVADGQADVCRLYAAITGADTAPRTKAKADLKGQKTVSEGGRYAYLQSVVAQYRARGMDRDEIYAAAVAVNARRCKPPKPDVVVRELVDWVCSLQPGPRRVIPMPAPAESAAAAAEGAEHQRPLIVGEAPKFSDDALAALFSERYAHDLRYVAAWGRWLQWDGARWAADETLHVFDRAREICRAASIKCVEKAAAGIASAATVAAVERLVRADRRHAATVGQWDADPWLLNTPGGLVDLRTGNIEAHRRDAYCAKLTAVAPGGACPQWNAFLDRVTGSNGELQSFLRRMVGYCLTADTREHALFFLYGTGANGKSVFLSTVAGILNDYAKSAAIETFIASASEQHPTDLAGLQGARLVTASETEDGRRWAESKIKTLTGGDRIAARFMRQDFFEFTPVFKLAIAGNHKPGLRSVDEAIRRRLYLVPFTVTIPPAERDLSLGYKLRTEWAGILSWALAGCLEWQAEGLNPPATVRDATEAYMAAEDGFAQWLDARCVRLPNVVGTVERLFTDWKVWAESVGEYIGSQKRFSQNLEERGFSRIRDTRGARAFRGIGLRVSDGGGDI